MSDSRSYVALDWVNAQIAETLGQAGDVLAGFIANPQDVTKLRFGLTYIHQVSGSLVMLELHAATLLSKEVERLLNKVLENSNAVVAQVDAAKLVITILKDLTSYLDKVVKTHEDHPQDLIEVLNKIREANQEDQLTEADLFNPNIAVVHTIEKQKPTIAVEEFNELIRKLRQSYQTSLIGIVRDKDLPSNYELLVKVTGSLLKVSEGTASYPLWEVASAIADQLLQANSVTDIETKKSLKLIDSQIKSLEENGRDELAKPVDSALLKSLLYSIAKAEIITPEVARLKSVYQLEKALEVRNSAEDEEPVSQSRIIDGLISALREELSYLASFDAEQMHQAQNRLQNTLQILGIKELLKPLQNIEYYINEAIDNGADVSEQAEQICSELEAIEQFVQAWEKRNAPIDGALVVSKYQTYLSNLREDIDALKQAFAEYVDENYESALLQTLPELLDRIVELMNVSSLRQQADIMQSVQLYICDELLEPRQPVSEGVVQALADAMSSVDYYIERLPADSADNLKKIYEVAASSIESLLNAESITVQPAKVYVDEEVYDDARGVDETEEASESPVGVNAIAHNDERVSEDISAAEVSEDEILIFVPGEEADQEILEIFIEEAREVVEHILEYLPQLEANYDNMEALLEIRRSYHTLKGSGRMVGALHIGDFAWSVERMMNKVRDGLSKVNATTIAILQLATDLVPALINDLENQTGVKKKLIQNVIDRADAEWEGREVLAAEEPEIETESLELTDSEQVIDEFDSIPVLTAEHETELSDEAEEDAAFDRELLAIFITEAETHIQVFSDYLDGIDPGFEEVFVSQALQRSMHTLKGSSHMAGVECFAVLATPIEAFIKDLNNFQTPLDAEILALLVRGCDLLQNQLSAVKRKDLVLIDGALPFIDEINRVHSETIAIGDQQETGGKLSSDKYTSLLTEALDCLGVAAELLQEWQSDGLNADKQDDLISYIYRLSGTAGEANYAEIEKLAEALGDFYSKAIQASSIFNPEFFELANKAHEELENMMDMVASHQQMELPHDLITMLNQGVEFELAAPITAYKEAQQPAVKVEMDLSALQSQLMQADADTLEIFTEEALELLDLLDRLLQVWFDNHKDRSGLNEIKRAIHTLKGGARLTELQMLADLTHAYEGCIENADGKGSFDDKFFVQVESFQNQLAYCIQYIASGEYKAPLVGVLEVDAAHEETIPADDDNFFEEFESDGLDKEFDEITASEEFALEDIPSALADEIYDLDSFDDDAVDILDDADDENSVDKLDGLLVEAGDDEYSIDVDTAEEASLDEAFAGFDDLDIIPTDDINELLPVAEVADTDTLEEAFEGVDDLDAMISNDDINDMLPVAEVANADEFDDAFAGFDDIESMLGLDSVDDILPVADIEVLESEVDSLEEALAAFDDNEVAVEDMAKNEFLPLADSVELQLSVEDTFDANEIAELAQLSAIEEGVVAQQDNIETATSTTLHVDHTYVLLAEFYRKADQETLEIFLEEALELDDELDEYVSEWLSNREDHSSAGALKRILHTLKGGARLAELPPLGDLTHNYETAIEHAEAYNQFNDAFFAEIQSYQDQVHGMIQFIAKGAKLEDIPVIGNQADAESDVTIDTPYTVVSSEEIDISLAPSVVQAASTPVLEEQASSPYAVLAEQYGKADQETLEIFMEEALELDASLDEAVNSWLTDRETVSHADGMKRLLHTLKGGARLAELSVLGDLTHEFESMIEHAEVRKAFDNAFFDNVQAYFDQIHGLIEFIANGARTSDIPTGAHIALTPIVADLEPLVQVQALEEVEAIIPAEDIDNELLTLFVEEAKEQSDSIEECIVKFAADTSDKSQLEELKRLLHTLKGGARLTGLRQIGDLSHDFETYIINSERESALGVLFVDGMQGFHEKLAKYIAAIQVTPLDNAKEVAKTAMSNVVPIRADVSVMANSALVSQAAVDATRAFIENYNKDQQRSNREPVKIAPDLLETLINLAGESSIGRSRIEEQMNEIVSSQAEMDATVDRLHNQLRRLEIETEAQIDFRKEQVVSEGHENFDPLEMDRYTHMQQLSKSLIESASDLDDISATFTNKMRDMETLLLQQARVNTELQESLMRCQMVPFSRMVPRLRRIVRQVAQELGKKVEFEVENAEGELDRTILERMVAPLEHMLRNAVDHGIEMPDVRKAAGKPVQGMIKLILGREGGEIVLNLVDDGAGVNITAVRKKAIERGLMAEDAVLSDHELSQFILHAGFSTAQKVTQISGRGVGMDVVHSEIKQMGGSLDINSAQGKGSNFTVRLPFTVSVNRALMVVVGTETYAIPLNAIEGIVRVSPYELEAYYQPDAPMFEYAGQGYHLRYMGALLRRGNAAKLEGLTTPLPVVLIRSSEYTVAVQVDRLLGSREVVVKSLGPQFGMVGGLSGATVLGDGSVVVILDMLSLIRTDIALGSLNAQIGRKEEYVADVVRKVTTVMVVDDSVTVRKVTSRLLERVGLNVILAKDGLDALTQLQEMDNLPDVILLDIEMPRMDGFEVVSRVRHDNRLQHIPITMITSRTGDKHRERAIALGANRYLGKPFQERELLQTIIELTGADIQQA